MIRLLIPSTGILRTYIENVMLREVQTTYDVRILEALANGAKTFPINRPNNKKKTFYEINDNLMRFYFAYIFGKEGIIQKFGEAYFYDNFIANSIKDFISRRFEQIVAQYLTRQVRRGNLKKVTDIGTYWYDDPVAGSNGQFDCVVQYGDQYDFYECKFYEKPMSRQECDKEREQVFNISGINNRRICFAAVSGFDFTDEAYVLIDGRMLYLKNK